MRIAIALVTLALAVPSGVAAKGGKGKAAVAAAVVAAAAVATVGRGGGGRMAAEPRLAPPLDPARKVNEQDCRKPIDPMAGNLRCK